jgi:long-chain fatty acid transport protein
MMDLGDLGMLSCIPSLQGSRLNMSTKLSSVRRRAAIVALAALAGAVPTTARASGFLTDQFGSDQGNPALGNTYSVYFNPAAMAGMHGSEITLGGVIAARSLDYTRSSSALSYSGTTANGTPVGDSVYTAANTGQAHSFGVLGAPYIGFVTDFGGSHVRLGLASYIPFGGQVSWGKNDAFSGNPLAPGAYDGPQRWSSISASTSSLYETAAFAYLFEKARLGLGASFSVIRTGVTDTRARDVDGSDDILTSTNVIKEGRTYLDVSGIQVGASAGVYWEATEDRKLRLGVSYTSQPNFGTMRLGGTFKLTPGATSSEATVPVDLLQGYPDVIRVGAAWRVAPQAELRLDADWQRWSQFKYQCIVAKGNSCPVDSHGVTSDPTVKLDLPRDFQDSFKVRAGVAFWVEPKTEIFASASYESPPVGKSHEDPLIFDSTRVAGTLGVRHGFSQHWHASLSYTYVYFVPLTVNDSAYHTYAGTPQGVSASPSANGSYSSELYYFDAAVSYRF